MYNIIISIVRINIGQVLDFERLGLCLDFIIIKELSFFR